jgi:dUTP pyrophosphatase
MKARITRIRKDVVLPEYKTSGAAGFDIAVAEGGIVPAGGTLMLPTGLVIQAPANHMLAIFPRSSTFKKLGLRIGNTVGIVDEDFCGPEDEILLFFWNPGARPITIEPGTRLAQGIFIPVSKVDWDEGEPASPSRGGWGSTGGYANGKV